MLPPGLYSHEKRLIQYRSPRSTEEFADYFLFRWVLLRKPLGLPCGSERDALEDAAYHVAAYDRQSVIGVGRVHLEGAHMARVRYMAVVANYRGQGVGRAILGRLEQFARRQKVRICWLYARENAVEFYKRNGYVIGGVGDSELSGVRHERMEKHLG